MSLQPPPLRPPAGDWRERNARAAVRRRVRGDTIRTLSSTDLVKLHTRTRHAAAERLFTPKPQT